MEELCAVVRCERPAVARYAVCGRHWRQVPWALRMDVYEAWDDVLDGVSGALEVLQELRGDCLRVLQDPRRV